MKVAIFLQHIFCWFACDQIDDSDLQSTNISKSEVFIFPLPAANKKDLGHSKSSHSTWMIILYPCTEALCKVKMSWQSWSSKKFLSFCLLCCIITVNKCFDLFVSKTFSSCFNCTYAGSCFLVSPFGLRHGSSTFLVVVRPYCSLSPTVGIGGVSFYYQSPHTSIIWRDFIRISDWQGQIRDRDHHIFFRCEHEKGAFFSCTGFYARKFLWFLCKKAKTERKAVDQSWWEVLEANLVSGGAREIA